MNNHDCHSTISDTRMRSHDVSHTKHIQMGLSINILFFNMVNEYAHGFEFMYFSAIKH